MSRFRPPVRRKGDGFIIDVSEQESLVVLGLVGELRTLLTDPDPEPATAALLSRLFPPVYEDDAEMEAEYQRLMRDELVQSKLSALLQVETALGGSGRVTEAQLLAFMQAVNSIRLVLGVMLGISDEESADELDDVSELAESHEQMLYHYLSWILEWTVTAQLHP